MGCGLSQFERRRHEGGVPTTASEFDPPPQQQPQGRIGSEDGVKERETSPPTPQPRLGRGEGLERISVKRRPPQIKEDIGHYLGDRSFIRYPRSPSFRDFCGDSELPFGDAYDSCPDNDGNDMDSPGADRKFMSKSTMSSPKSHAKVAQSGSNDELTAALAVKTECKGTASPSGGVKMRNVLSDKRKWRGKQARIRAYIKASRWQKPRTEAVVKNE